MQVPGVSGGDASAGGERRGRLVFTLLLIATAQASWVLPQGPERIGDGLQVALPILGMACATARHGAADYALRFLALEAVVHGLKHGLGDAAIERRPNGGLAGFPSGHTSAAAYGASGVARECGALVPYVGPLAALAAGYVGATRVESSNHDTTQVLAGGLLGVGADLAVRGRQRRLRLHVAWAWVCQRLGNYRRAARPPLTRRDRP